MPTRPEPNLLSTTQKQKEDRAHIDRERDERSSKNLQKITEKEKTAESHKYTVTNMMQL